RPSAAVAKRQNHDPLWHCFKAPGLNRIRSDLHWKSVGKRAFGRPGGRALTTDAYKGCGPHSLRLDDPAINSSLPSFPFIQKHFKCVANLSRTGKNGNVILVLISVDGR